MVAPQSASTPERVRERIVAALERGAATFLADPGPGPAADAGPHDSRADRRTTRAGISPVLFPKAGERGRGRFGERGGRVPRERPALVRVIGAPAVWRGCTGGLGARTRGRGRGGDRSKSSRSRGRPVRATGTGVRRRWDARPARSSSRGRRAREASRPQREGRARGAAAIAMARVACRLEGGEFDGAAAGGAVPARAAAAAAAAAAGRSSGG